MFENHLIEPVFDLQIYSMCTSPQQTQSRVSTTLNSPQISPPVGMGFPAIPQHNLCGLFNAKGILVEEQW